MRATVLFIFAASIAASSNPATAQARRGQSAAAPPSTLADPARAPGTLSKFEVFRMLDKAVGDADFRAASATLQQIDTIFRRVQALAPPPVGVLMSVKPTVGAYDTWSPSDFPYRRDIVPSRYTVFFLHPTLFCPQGQCRVDRGEGPSFSLLVNTPHMLLARLTERRGLDAFYVAPRQIGQVARFPLYEGGRLVLTKRQQPIWLPVTQEEWVRYKIEQERQQEPDVRKRATAAGLSQSQVEQTYGPAFANSRRVIAQLEHELAALSPGERAAPAYCCGGYELGETAPLSGRSRPTALNVRMVVRLNKDFFDPNLSPSAPQIITFGDVPPNVFAFPWTDEEYEKLQGRDGQSAGENNTLFAAIRKELDWKALFDLLR